MVDKAADYGLTHRVVVLGDGENQPILVASAGWLEAMQSFHDVPSEVAALLSKVYFLELALPDVGDKDAPSGHVE